MRTTYIDIPSINSSYPLTEIDTVVGNYIFNLWHTDVLAVFVIYRKGWFRRNVALITPHNYLIKERVIKFIKPFNNEERLIIIYNK